jgi:hypothetical protein
VSPCSCSLATFTSCLVLVMLTGSGRPCPLDIRSPTRMNLTLTKQRLKGAQTGHSLLAKKRDALMTRFRAILRKVDEVSDGFP